MFIPGKEQVGIAAFETLLHLNVLIVQRMFIHFIAHENYYGNECSYQENTTNDNKDYVAHWEFTISS